MPLPRAPIDLARRGAWSAETTHAPRVPDVAVAAHRRAQPISKAFSRGEVKHSTTQLAISFSASSYPRQRFSAGFYPMFALSVFLQSKSPWVRAPSVRAWTVCGAAIERQTIPVTVLATVKGGWTPSTSIF